MKNRLYSAFDGIKADEALLQKTAAYLEAARIKPKKARPRGRPLRIAATLAAMLVLVVGTFGYRAFHSATAYVSIDVNPSVGLVLNRMDRVIGAEAYNAEGEALLQELALKGSSYDEAAAALLAAMGRQGYIAADTLVTLTVQTTDTAKEQVLCDRLLQLASEQLGYSGAQAEAEVFPVTQEVRETAHECHMSAAKYLAIQALLEVDETATLEEYSGSTIRQIRQRTQACQQGQGHTGTQDGSAGESGTDEAASGQGQGQGHHHGQGQGQEQGGGHGYRGGR